MAAQDTLQYEKNHFPLITIAIVCFNQSRYLWDCINSILCQQYPYFEIVVCDDGSYDFPKDEIRAYLEEKRPAGLVSYTVYHSEENLGTVKNCNKAFSLSNGEIVKLLAGDDMLYDKDVLTNIARGFESPEVNLLGGCAVTCLQDGTPSGTLYPEERTYQQLSGFLAHDLLHMLCTQPFSCILAPTIVFRRSYYVEMGGFSEDYIYLEDWPFWIKACEKGERIRFVQSIFIWYRAGGISSHQQDKNYEQSFRRTFMEECITVLKTQGMEAMKLHGSLFARIKCLFSIWCFHIQIIQNFEWDAMTFIEKLWFKTCTIPFRLFNRVMGILTRGGNIVPKTLPFNASLLLVLCVLMSSPFFVLQIQNSKYLLAVVLLLLLLIVVFQSAVTAILLLLRGIANYRHRISKRGDA